MNMIRNLGERIGDFFSYQHGNPADEISKERREETDGLPEPYKKLFRALKVNGYCPFPVSTSASRNFRVGVVPRAKEKGYLIPDDDSVKQIKKIQEKVAKEHGLEPSCHIAFSAGGVYAAYLGLN